MANEIIYREDGEMDVDATMRAATSSCFDAKAQSDGVLITWPAFDHQTGEDLDWVWQSRAQAEEFIGKLKAALGAG